MIQTGSIPLKNKIVINFFKTLREFYSNSNEIYTPIESILFCLEILNIFKKYIYNKFEGKNDFPFRNLFLKLFINSVSNSLSYCIF